MVSINVYLKGVAQVMNFKKATTAFKDSYIQNYMNLAKVYLCLGCLTHKIHPSQKSPVYIHNDDFNLDCHDEDASQST